MTTPDAAANIRRAAWDKIVSALDELADAPELFPLEARGAELFVWELKRICTDIGQHVETGTLDEAMQKLAAGFGRYRKLVQDQPKAEAKAWVQEEWAAHRDAYQDNKSAFARDYSKRLMNERSIPVTDREIRERWLTG